MSVIPAVDEERLPEVPDVAERTLANGLRVLAVKRGDVPRVELRMRIPLVPARAAGDGARERLLSETIASGTASRTSLAIAEELQALGGGLRAGASSDELVISGSCLAESLGSYLDLLDEVLEDAVYDDDEVAVAQGRLAQEITILRSQPTVTVSDALHARIYGKHPYGRGLPAPEAFASVGPVALRRLHANRVVPNGTVLVVVGDVRTTKALDEAERALGPWVGEGATATGKGPAAPSPKPTLLIDRPGSVQTNIRMGGPVVGRRDPDHPRIQVANMIFGGYFSSRLMANIREDKGYSYSPRSAITHHRHASHLTVAADVGSEVTIPALLEVRYELARMATGSLKADELAAAKRYVVGTLALATQTQAGLASWLSAIVADGLTVEFLRDYPQSVDAVTSDEVTDAALHYLGPRGLQTVLVGEAAGIQRQLEALDAVEVQPSAG
jgi:predicted Zn-dependent peptidase